MPFTGNPFLHSVQFNAKPHPLCTAPRLHSAEPVPLCGPLPWPCPESGRLTFTDGITRLFSLWPPVGVYGRACQDGDYRSEGKEVSAPTPTLLMAGSALLGFCLLTSLPPLQLALALAISWSYLLPCSFQGANHLPLRLVRGRSFPPACPHP